MEVKFAKSQNILFYNWLSVLTFTIIFLSPVNALASTFVDSSQANFNTGTYFRTQWSGGANSWVQLTNSGRNNFGGTYTSGVDDAGFNATWNSLAWVPSSPYGKELPSNLGIETIYNSNNVSMSGNVAYYRLNESSGTSIADSSGNGNLGTCAVATCPTLGASGKLNGAVNFNGTNNFITVPNSISTTLNGTASLVFWIKTTQTGNATFWQAPTVIGYEQNGNGDDIFWGNLDNNGRIALYVGDSGFVKSTNPINDGNWHHIAMTRNSTTGQAIIYVDGTSNNTATLDTGNKTPTYTGLGRLEASNGTPGYVYFAGSLDEVALFNRVLSPAEVTSIYRRGVLRLLYQVRSCPNTACTGVNFEGPDGTTGTYFSEIDNDTINLPIFNLSNLNAPLNRYFQYFISFQTDDNSITPSLKSVTIDYSQYIPTISLNIRNNNDTADTNTCDLGSLTTTSVSSCSYRVKVSTNTANGYTIFMKASGNLVSSSNSIPNANPGSGGSGGTNITAGAQVYGAQVLAGSITGGSISVTNLFNAGATNSVLFNYAANTNILTATGGNNPTLATQSSLITHNLGISGNTPAGYYTQSITYGVVPSF